MHISLSELRWIFSIKLSNGILCGSNEKILEKKGFFNAINEYIPKFAPTSMKIDASFWFFKKFEKNFPYYAIKEYLKLLLWDP